MRETFDWWGGRAAGVPAGRGKGMLYPLFRGWQGVPAAREGEKTTTGYCPSNKEYRHG